MPILKYAASGMGALFNVVNESVSDVIDAMKAGLAIMTKGVRDGWNEMVDGFRKPRNPASDSENEGNGANADELTRLKNELTEEGQRSCLNQTACFGFGFSGTLLLLRSEERV